VASRTTPATSQQVNARRCYGSWIVRFGPAVDATAGKLLANCSQYGATRLLDNATDSAPGLCGSELTSGAVISPDEDRGEGRKAASWCARLRNDKSPSRPIAHGSDVRHNSQAARGAEPSLLPAIIDFGRLPPALMSQKP
jgi:hypothetical protein